MKSIQPGKVVLAGAGPGDPDLITIRLQRAMEQADVIITDRLVNPQIIQTYARPDAEIVLAGKQGYQDASATQPEINELIRTHALRGKNVLRLKGGDVAFFSNVLDELQTVSESNISFEIIPGITAASGASAYTGIPLTSRGFSQGVQILTFNPNSRYSPEKWKQLANSDDTLVFYMAAKNMRDLAELLLRYSHYPNMALAVIEAATTPQQRVYISTLDKCTVEFEGKIFASPSLVIIGKVVSLYENFKWFQRDATSGIVFRGIGADS
jgi:uroporphyrin-III C-methyltransferase